MPKIGRFTYDSQPFAEGGFGKVYEGTDGKNKVIVKEIMYYTDGLPKYRGKITKDARKERIIAIENEIEVSKYLSDNVDFVPKFYDSMIDEDRAFIVMEHIDALPLFYLDYIIKDLPIENHMKIKLDLMMQLASKLDKLHSLDVVYRDMDPSNCLLKKKGDGYEVIFIDFGAACIYNINDKFDREKRSFDSKLGYKYMCIFTVQGKLSYVSPEAINAHHYARAHRVPEKVYASDVWSLGAVFYFILLGTNILEDRQFTVDDLMRIYRDQPKFTYIIETAIKNVPTQFNKLFRSIFTHKNDGKQKDPVVDYIDEETGYIHYIDEMPFIRRATAKQVYEMLKDISKSKTWKFPKYKSTMSKVDSTFKPYDWKRAETPSKSKSKKNTDKKSSPVRTSPKFKGKRKSTKPDTDYTVKELKELAKKQKIKGYSKMKKQELYEAVFG